MKIKQMDIYKHLHSKRNHIKFDLTEEGKPYGIWKDTTKKHHNGTPVKQLLYKKSIIKVSVQHTKRFFVHWYLKTGSLASMVLRLFIQISS